MASIYKHKTQKKHTQKHRKRKINIEKTQKTKRTHKHTNKTEEQQFILAQIEDSVETEEMWLGGTIIYTINGENYIQPNESYAYTTFGKAYVCVCVLCEGG